MIVISHRGWWLRDDERNRREAFHRSFDAGFGTETDLRDICGTIVISHDMPTGEEMTLEDLLAVMDGRNLPLALNIKADGMAQTIRRILAAAGHTNYFTFDMSIPDEVVQLAAGLPVFTGLSDLLTVPPMLDEARGVWLDAFRGVWYDGALIRSLLEQGKRVCVVSEELHRRDPRAQWEMLRATAPIGDDRLILCSDIPQQAQDFFGNGSPASFSSDFSQGNAL